jgi:glutamate racemase
MKIGVFDSGLGGLVIAYSLVSKMPQYDYIYLGDTDRAPYGNRPEREILEYTSQGVEALFKKGCKLVIVACNSASADALRVIQRQHLKAWPGCNTLGVLIPSAEQAVISGQRIGVICTQATADSGAFTREIHKLSATAEVFHKATPRLVDNIESGQMLLAKHNLQQYLRAFSGHNIDTLVLGCTHYPLLKKEIRDFLGDAVNVISQDEIVPAKLQDYLTRHKEIASDLSTGSNIEFFATKITPAIKKLACQLFSKSVLMEQIDVVGPSARH